MTIIRDGKEIVLTKDELRKAFDEVMNLNERDDAARTIAEMYNIDIDDALVDEVVENYRVNSSYDLSYTMSNAVYSVLGDADEVENR